MMNTSNPSFFPLVRTWDQLEDPHRSNVSFIFFIASPFKFITVASSISFKVVNSNFSPTCLKRNKEKYVLICYLRIVDFKILEATQLLLEFSYFLPISFDQIFFR